MLAVGVAVLVTLVVVGKINVKEWVKDLGGSVQYVFEKGDKKAAGEESGYSAVFLANGQVYFGKLATPTNQYVTLTDVFYLRIQQQLQPREDKEEEGQTKRETQLIKLGEELHGPMDEIKINRDQVLFIEKMKTDSRVVQGIKKFYEQKK